MEKDIKNNSIFNNSHNIQENYRNFQLNIKTTNKSQYNTQYLKENKKSTGITAKNTNKCCPNSNNRDKKSKSTSTKTKNASKKRRKRRNREYLKEQLEILEHLNPGYMKFRPNPINLGEYSNEIESKKTLILNLESFIHLETSDIEEHFEYISNQEFTSKSLPFYVRAHTYEFLFHMKSYYEIVFFTSLDKDLAKDILQVVWGEDYKSENILGRERCSLIGDFTIKELRTINDRAEENMVILDHELAAWCFDQENYVAILPFDVSTQNEGLEEGVGLMEAIDILKELAYAHKYHVPLYIHYCKSLLQ